MKLLTNKKNMATNKLTIQVQHGETKCECCPGFFNNDLCYDLNYECELYDYSTMRILKIENQ